MTTTGHQNRGAGSGGLVTAAIGGAALLAVAAYFAIAFKLVDLQQYGLATALLLTGLLLNIVVIAALAWSASRRIKGIEFARAASEEARLAAENLLAEKARLLATMSHEIRTPLNGVIGMINLMQETGLTEEQRNYAGMANASSRMLLSIVDEVLDRAKADARPGHAAPPYDPRLILESTCELLAARAIGKRIDISSYVAPGVPLSLAKGELALRQIVFNLAGNAIKFTETGHVGVELLAPQQGWLRLKVADTGLGMTQDQLARVFRDYEQATPDTYRQFGGTGLGLGIVRGLVEQWGGHIDVESRPGEGTTFTVNLPVPAFENLVISTPLAGRSFILAMPQGAARNHLERSLQDHGAQVELAEGSANIASAIRNTSVTVIADAERLSAMRNLRHPSNVWVILKPEERRQYRNLLHNSGLAGYLLKPLRRSSLLARLTPGQVPAIDSAPVTARAAAHRKSAHALRLLVADDNPVNLLLARTMLEKSGHKVTTAVSGEAVLDALAASSAYDMLLLDVEMPGLNGHQTAEAIRAREGRSGRHLPILGLTAHARPEELQACLASGMDDYLSKPYDSEDLAEMIEKLRTRAAA